MSQHPVKVDPLAPGEDCWGKPSAFFALLAKKLFVELPAGLISKIWQGPSEPPSDKKDWLWYNETAKGKPIGFFSFYKGEQVPVWPAPTGAAPSRDPPAPAMPRWSRRPRKAAAALGVGLLLCASDGERESLIANAPIARPSNDTRMSSAQPGG